MTILDKLAEHARERVAREKEQAPLEQVKEAALALKKGDFVFERALKNPGISFICECKKASPSKGVIAQEFPYMQIANEYEAAGADAISVLTEPKWFLGADEYLGEIANNVSVPCLRKDFTVNEYMIYRAKLLGAQAVLLICSILPAPVIAEYLEVCDSLGMCALVEAHSRDEAKGAVSAGARIIGVNNRNLNDFTVDTRNSQRIRDAVPPGVVFVAESGVAGREDVARLEEMGADAVLVGEALMRAADKAAKLKEFKYG